MPRNVDIALCSSLLIIHGLGDGALIDACLADPAIAKKDIEVIAYGDEPIPEKKWPSTARVARIRSWDEAQSWVTNRFSDHNDIVRLGGADIVRSDNLAPESETVRTELLPRLEAMLADRPWALGNDINDSFMGLWHASQNARLLLPAPSLGQIAGAFGEMPAISVGAGPSVAEHIDALRALQDRCLIVASDSVTPGLVKEGVIPHIVTPLERLKQQAQFVQCVKGTRAVFCGIAACHPATLEPFGDRMIYLHAMDRLYDWLAPSELLRCPTGSSTGVLSFYVAASLTRGPVYLVGHDLAKEDGASHWAQADFAGKAFAKEEQMAGGHGSNGYESRLIPGNSGKLLTSIMWWDHFRTEIATQAALMGPRVFNVNAHTGRYAKIENTQAAPLPDPDSLPLFELPDPKRVNEARYDDWRTRAREAGADAERFLAGMDSLRRAVATMRQAPAHTWELESLMSRVVPDQHVSAGNLAGFQYFLRSALYNEQAFRCGRARTYASRASAYWDTMQGVDGLSATMSSAVRHLQPLITRLGDC